MKQIHGHEVLEMILESGKSYTRDSLEQAILGKFGDQSRFHTCSAEGMTARELIEFLEKRGKFVPACGGFTTAREKICSHEGHHDHHD